MLQTEDDLLHRELPFSSVPFCVILALTERQSPGSGGSAMTFDEILDQVITLLKRQGRVSYSALKRRFDLDDDYLNDLKDELLYVHPVQDDEGRGLVWVGNVEGTIDTPAPPPQSIPAPLIQDPPSVQHESPLGTTRIPEAERRQLTVMFIDIVESTQLASQLDPEEYRDVVRAYQTACTEIVQRYDGHVAQLLGDGLLIYFGYPHAHEDDAQRAVRAGLGILAALEDLNISLKRDKGIQLAVRLGIDTGWSLLGTWAEQGVRNSSRWVKRQTLPPEFKDWLSLIPLLSVKPPIA
jgi:hypothetical protein